MVKKLFSKKAISIILAIAIVFVSITCVSAYSQNTATPVITLEDDTLNIKVGEESRIIPFMNFGEFTFKDFRWFSTDPSVVTVKEFGFVTGVKEGTATVICSVFKEGSTRQNTAACVVTVSKPDVTVAIENEEQTIIAGDTLNYEAVVTYKKDIKTTTEWNTSDSSVAVIDNDGELVAKEEGTTTVECVIKNEKNNQLTSATTVLTVAPAVTTIDLNTPTLTWEIGKTGYYKPEIESNDKREKDLVYKSSDTSVATVNDEGKLVAKDEGNTTITCDIINKETKEVLDTDICKVEVYNEVDKISLHRVGIDLQLGKIFRFKETVAPSDATYTDVLWTSSKPSVATVDQDGKIKTVGVGTTVITCRATDRSGELVRSDVNVYKPTTDVNITIDKATLEIGKTKNLNVKYEPSNAFDKDVVWKSSNPRVARIVNGKVTAVSAGTTTITCIYQGNKEIVDTCKITVPQPKVSYSDDDLYCMAAVIWQEAGALYCSDELQLLVGSVVMNHVKSSYFPDTIRGVITRPGAYGTMGWTGVHLPSSNDYHTQKAIDRCYKNAKKVLSGEYDIPDSVIYQAGFVQGSGVYKYQEGMYFCYQ